MKYTISIAVVLVVLGGWYWYSSTAPEAVPQEEGTQKVDPRVVCQSALMYMTFESGEAADAFVEACVRGEHPEVIERYQNDNAPDGAML